MMFCLGAPSSFEDAALVDFISLVFTCVLTIVVIDDSGLCCCVPC